MSEAPDYLEPIYGVREWTVAYDGQLESIALTGSAWKPGQEHKAVCRTICTGRYSYYRNAAGQLQMTPAYESNDEHEAPVRGCGCGLYAWYNRDCAEKHGDGPLGIVRVRGVVSAWGRVVLSEYGFKAECMKIEALLLESKTMHVLGVDIPLREAHEALAKRYGVPLITVEELATFGEGMWLEPQPLPTEKLDMIDPPGLITRLPPAARPSYYHTYVGSYTVSRNTSPQHINSQPPPEPRWLIWLRQTCYLMGALNIAWIVLVLVAGDPTWLLAINVFAALLCLWPLLKRKDS